MSHGANNPFNLQPVHAKIDYNKLTQGLSDPDSCLESCQNNNKKIPKVYQTNHTFSPSPMPPRRRCCCGTWLPQFRDHRPIRWRSMSPGKYHWPRHRSPEPSHRVAEPHPSTLPNLDPCPTYPRGEYGYWSPFGGTCPMPWPFPRRSHGILT